MRRLGGHAGIMAIMMVGALLVPPLQLFAQSGGASPSVQAFEGYAAFKQGDHARAYAILKPVAEVGHRGAMIQLAYLYEHGLGVERSEERAAYWMARVEEQDHRD
ncbi:MAG: hypothetical protein LAT50_17645 [Ectothiorhodospiraceae bacterium]|nr:sel1 repeat family protein [Paracoccaceae bacterium]MCH8506124.1 hypothetical protein [Ectothiorhodospiraceae bacterium]